MFFFAWANAGVKVAGAGGMTWVVLASLLLGKVFGIVLMVRQ
jgi:Na+/H+ antiporter NhaA